jgi:hypothetical protein
MSLPLTCESLNNEGILPSSSAEVENEELFPLPLVSCMAVAGQLSCRPHASELSARVTA